MKTGGHQRRARGGGDHRPATLLFSRFAGGKAIGYGMAVNKNASRRSWHDPGAGP